MVEPQTGLLTRPWQQWFAALLLRSGGSGEAPTNAELAALVTALGTPDHLLAGPVTPPTVAARAAGAGVGATVTVSGTDSAGTITLTTAARVARRSHSAVVQLTFAAAWPAAPRVLLTPANDAAMALEAGRLQGPPCRVRIRQADVTTTGVTLRVGVTRLPREADTYVWNYLAVG